MPLTSLAFWAFMGPLMLSIMLGMDHQWGQFYYKAVVPMSPWLVFFFINKDGIIRPILLQGSGANVTLASLFFYK
jgi:hypothetical protein